MQIRKHLAKRNAKQARLPLAQPSPAADMLLKRDALHKIHHDDTVRSADQLITDTGQRRMLELTHQPGFPQRVLFINAHARELSMRHDLQRHLLPASHILGQKHAGHAAAADLPHDLVSVIDELSLHLYSSCI